MRSTSARYIRAVEGDPEGAGEGEEPREDEEKKSIPGTVLLAVRELVRPESTNSFQTWNE
eukprot:9504129-Pyramimonas_sp.AAC.2